MMRFAVSSTCIPSDYGNQKEYEYTTQFDPSLYDELIVMFGEVTTSVFYTLMIERIANKPIDR